jgi:hypothetical protein
MKQVINLDELLGNAGVVTQLFRIIANITMLPIQINVYDHTYAWNVKLSITNYGKYKEGV